MSLKQKAPITLRVEITNDSDEPKLVSLKFHVAPDLSVEKTGIANIIEKKIGEMAPGQLKLFYFEIYPKVATRVRDYPARFTVYEHYNEYEFISKEFKKEFAIKVIE